MKYQKVTDKLNAGSMSRVELEKLKTNAQRMYQQGDEEAIEVISAIQYAKPVDDYILFMGFCPGADFSERLDIEWKEKGICRFDYLESEVQLERFSRICTGDLVVLKKREVFGVSMNLYGYGRVTKVCYDQNNIRYLEVDWAAQHEIIEVPLMGCNSTVDIKSMDDVEGEMPNEFFDWLSL